MKRFKYSEELYKKYGKKLYIIKDNAYMYKCLCHGKNAYYRQIHPNIDSDGLYCPDCKKFRKVK